MFKLVIVDLIGILFENENEYSLFKKITNYKGTIQSLKAHTSNSYDKLIKGEIYQNIFWDNLIKKSKTRRKLDNVKKDFFNSLKPIFDVNLFNKAKNYFKFALCADFYHMWWYELKKEHNIEFDYEALSSKVKMRKDSNEMYLNAMINFKLKPHECLVVSDEINDLRLAKKLGMKTMLIIGKSKEFKDADYVYDKFDDFLKALI